MKRLLLSSVSCLLSAPVWAQTAPTPDVLGTNLLGRSSMEQIVVSATRSPQTLDRIGSSVTVLTAADIKATQTLVISDLLARTPGLSFSRNGGPGGVTALRIRGAEGDQTVVIIDGVKINDPSAVGGGYNFANLLAGDIERIEVLRGAQSTLWGSQAIGGVVNIVTATPAKSFEGSVEAEGGSRNTFYVSGGAGGATERAVWRIAGSHYTTDGVSAYDKGAEADADRNTGVSGRVQFNVSDEISLDARAVYSDNRNDADGFPPPLFSFADTTEYGTVKEFIGYGGVNAALFDGRLKNRFAYAYTDTDRNTYNPAQTPTPVTFDGKGKNKRWEYQGAAALTEGWSAVFGVEDEKSSFRTASPSSFDPTPTPDRAKVGITSVYAQAQGDAAQGLTLTGGLRYDDHETFGGRTLGQAAVAWALNEEHTILRASFGQGFKAPTLYQLYSPYGNTRLKPEEADSWDAGVEQRWLDGDVVFSATWFARKTKNQIDFDFCPGNPFCAPASFGVYDNIARTKAHGVELQADATLDRFTLQANYTYTDTENTSPGSANKGKVLARRPKNTANVSFDYQWPFGLSTGVAVRYVGDSFDNAANTAKLEDYTLVDLRASAPLNETFEIYGRIQNLFDKTYATTRNYGEEGLGAFAGIRAKF